MVDGIKHLLNNFPSAAFWHDGNIDDACKFNGLHLHVLAAADKKLSQITMIRTLKTKLSRHNVTVRRQHVKYIENLCRHLQTEPRVLLGCNNMDLCAILHRTKPLAVDQQEQHADTDFKMDEIYEEEVDQSKKEGLNWIKSRLTAHKPSIAEGSKKEIPDMRSYIVNKANSKPTKETLDNILKGNKPRQEVLPSSKTAAKFDILKDLIKKYNTTTTEELLRAIVQHGDKEDLALFRTLRLGPWFKDVLLQAISELDMESKQRGDTLVDKLIEQCPIVDISLNTVDTAVLFKKWCEEQSICAGSLLLNMYMIATCNKDIPKINDLMLQGRSNAGKTYWGNMLTSIPELVGQTIQSSDFAYQHCVDKELILIPELSLTKPEQVEEFKVMEGLPILVNIKNKEGRKLEKTPVFLTCNRVPWASFGNESAAIKNRMIRYEKQIPSDVLKNVSEPPDPRFLVQVFQFIKANIEPKAEYPCAPDDDFFKLYAEFIEEFVDTLIDDGVITYPRLVEDLQTGPQFHMYSEMAQMGARNRLNCHVPLYQEGYVESIHTRLLPWMKLQFDPMALDYYWSMKDYREPVLISAMTNRK